MSAQLRTVRTAERTASVFTCGDRPVTIEAEAVAGVPGPSPTAASQPRSEAEMRRRQRHSWKRSVAQVLAEAQARDEAEQRAAIERILSQPTTRLPVITPRTAPLMTPGQAARASRRQQ